MHPVLLEFGSFPLGTYGLLLAIAFFAGTALAKRQGALDGLSPSAITDLAIAMLISALLGSKLLMIAVDLIGGAPLREVFSLGTLRAGGAIHGGIIAATAVFFWKLRKGQGLPLRLTGDALVPGVALGQAIGRVGCFLTGLPDHTYGVATSLPWGVTIDPAFRPAAYAAYSTFQPTFLYESLWNLGVFALLLAVIIPRLWNRVRPGTIFAAYLVLYGIGRMWVERLRIDPAHVIAGVRLNDWVFGVVVIGALIYLIVSLRRRQPAPV